MIPTSLYNPDVMITRQIGDSITDVQTVATHIDILTLLAEVNFISVETVVSLRTEIAALGANDAALSGLYSILTELQSLYADKITLDSIFADKVTLDSLYADKAALDSIFTDKATLDSLFGDKITLDSLFADKLTLDSLYADKIALDGIFASKAAIDSVYADKTTLDSLYADKATLDSLFGDKITLDSLFADKAILDSLYTDKITLDSVHANKVVIDGVYANEANITTTAGIASEITTVASDTLAIQGLVAITAKLNSLFADKITLDSLYADKATLDSLFTDKTTLDSLFTDKLTLDSLFADKLKLDSLFADKLTLDGLFASKTAIDSLFTIQAKLESLFADKTKLDSLFTDKATLDSIYADKLTLDSLVFDKVTLDSIYADKAAIDAVYGSLGAVNTVSTSIISVNTVATNIVGLQTILTNMVAILDAATQASAAAVSAAAALASEQAAAVSAAEALASSTSIDVSEFLTQTSTHTFTNKTIDDYTNTVHADATHIRVKATVAIAHGQAVAFSGYNSGQDAIKVVLADQATMVSIGIADDAIGVGEFGNIISNGILDKVDTSGYTEGTILYLSGTGLLTPTQPTTGIMQPIAFVLKAHAINGALMVNAGYPKQDASDVRFDTTKSVADELALKVDDTQVLTDVPVGALFTDTNTVYTHPTNHPISVVTGLQTALDGKLPLTGGTMTGALNLAPTGSTTNTLSIRKANDASYSGMRWYSDERSEEYLQYTANNQAGDMTFRTKTDAGVNKYVWAVARDTGVMNFKTAPTVNGAKMWTEGNDGSGSGLDADKLDGYHATSLATGSTVAVRNSSADLSARLFRSNYPSASSISSNAAVCFRNNNSSDNYMRFVTQQGLSDYVRMGSTNYYNANIPDTWILNESVLGDTAVGATDCYIECMQVGRMAAVTMDLRITGFSRTIPSDSTFQLDFNLVATGLVPSITNVRGLAHIEFLVSGLDSPYTGCRVYSSGGRVKFHVGETAAGYSSRTATEAYLHSSFVVRW